MRRDGNLDVGTLRSKLTEDVMALRRGPGLTLSALEHRTTLLTVLQAARSQKGESVSVSDCLASIVELIRNLDRSQQSRALRAALGLADPGSEQPFLPDPGRLTSRRRALADALGVHPDTIKNYEKSKISELVLVIEDMYTSTVTSPQSKVELREATPTSENPLRLFLGDATNDVRVFREGLARALDSEKQYEAIRLDSDDLVSDDTWHQQMGRASVFIAIIGQNLTVSPDYGLGQSPLVAQYEHAVHQHLSILVYIFTGRRQLSTGSAEVESTAYDEFVGRLKENHPIRFFSSIGELIAKTTLDLAQIRHDSSSATRDGPYQLFSEDVEEIRDAIDVGNRKSRNEVRLFLEYLADRFEPLFRLQRESLGQHPLFRDANERLSRLVPEFSLTSEDGVILRTGVRHMIMRTQTVVLLLRSIPPGVLAQAGSEVGQSAAQDLLASVVRQGRSLPTSPQAFVALWNYWDRTGGWGRYELLRQTEESWQILIHNNFLHSGLVEIDPSQLQPFWEGYIEGFLNRALPEISAVMMHLPERERALRVSMPAAVQVVSVEYAPDAAVDADVFNVQFDRGAFSDPLRGLIGARYYMERGDYATAVIWARGAIRSAEERLGDDFVKYFRDHKAAKSDAVTFGLLSSSQLPPNDMSSAANCLALANRVIQDLLAQSKFSSTRGKGE